MVEKVVTEHGIAEGRSIRERAQSLIAIAAPVFRDDFARRRPPPRLSLSGRDDAPFSSRTVDRIAASGILPDR